MKTAWSIIESQPVTPIPMTPERGRKSWKVVRLFVSSTFTDMFEEREVLVKDTIPRLRSWCEGRRIKLVEVDLRWGVPKESTTEVRLRALSSLSHDALRR